MVVPTEAVGDIVIAGESAMEVTENTEEEDVVDVMEKRKRKNSKSYNHS